MKYRNWIILLVLIGIALGIGVYLVVYSFGDKNNEQDEYQATRTEANVNNTNNDEKNKQENEVSEAETTNIEEQEGQVKAPQPVETEIASFSTNIVTKDASRQKNISITCGTLNETIVEQGETFSFCDTVGKATTEKGYEKADVFDAKRK